MVALIIVGIIVLVWFLSGLYIVTQQSAKIIERFGKFLKISQAGLHWRIPVFDRIAGTLSLKIQQLDVRIETKTKDNVFVYVVVSVQYHVIHDKVIDAFYRLQQPDLQIRSYVYDVVRARVPVIKLDTVFETKDEIARAVKNELSQIMDDFGYGIIKALVTDIDPDAKVKASMNQIQTAQRLRLAAVEEAEAQKIRVVKAAEAEATSKALQGKGIADQRLAIVNGLRESVTDFQDNVPGTSAHDVMNLVLMTQYFDTLTDIGVNSATNTILIPHSPGGMNQISDQLRDAMLQANAVDKSDSATKKKPPASRPNSSASNRRRPLMG